MNIHTTTTGQAMDMALTGYMDCEDAARLREQLARYLENERLSAAVVVSQRPCALPERIAGKPVRVVALNRLWGVALP